MTAASRMRALLAIAALCAGFAFTRAEGPRADDPEVQFPTRRVGVHVSGDVLHVTFSYRDVFTPQVRKKMTSGLPTRLLVHCTVESEKEKPITYWARSAEIVYDLWEEQFAIAVSDPAGKRRTRVGSLEQAVDAAGILWRAPVADTGEFKPGSYRLRAMVEVNPVSEEMVRNIQRWIARPKGVQGDNEARTNFFGAFVGRFVDRGIGQAERVIGFVSQPFDLGRP
jgi:hypothetical protein